MSKRALTLACATALVAAACGSLPKGTVDAGSGARFVTMVADSLDNVGLGNQVVVDPSGLPSISYWGFPAKVKPGEIPTTRPIGAPFIPAVQVAALSKNNIWTRGAAAQAPAKNSPNGIVVPFGPVTEAKLANASADNTNGTDIVIGPDGTKHVVWASTDGVYYASGTTSFTVHKLFGLAVDLTAAGPIGRPSVALDGSGKPWVAYAANASKQEVRVETPDAAGKWVTTIVARLPQCGGCPQPGVTRIGVTPSGTVVAYGSAQKVMVATGNAGVWTSQQVASNVSGSGLGMALGKDGSVYLTYYSGDGSVQLATNKGGSWATSKVADAAASPSASGASASPAPTTPATGNALETTGVTVDDAGKVYVTYYDGASDSIKVVSGDGSTFAPVQTTNTVGGRYPSIAVTPDGSLVYVAWYASSTQDLLMGIWGNQPSYAIGYPSPTPSVGGQSNANCGADKKVVLDEVAKGTAFLATCLVAPAGKPFSINFDNQDPAATVGQHNIAVASDSVFSKFLFHGAAVNGPAKTVYPVTKLAAGTYFFHCDFHPTSMTGTLVVVAGAK